MLGGFMGTPSSLLHDLAAAVGLAREWRDVDGQTQVVGDAALGAILEALGHKASSEHQISSSLKELADAHHSLPVMIVVDAGTSCPVPLPDGAVEVTDAAGQSCRLHVEGGVLSPVAEPGYYDLVAGRQATRLAVAPRHCPLPKRKGWGASVQIPALRGAAPRAFGSLAELTQSVEALAHAGADAVAINPVHALFPGVGEGFSPYSPSSRLFLNSAMGDPALVGLPPLPATQGSDLIDWPKALPERFAQLRAVFDALDADRRHAVSVWAAGEGATLKRHAIFDALDRHFRPGGAKGWTDWPAAYRDPSSPAVTKFAEEKTQEVDVHLFLQWLATNGLDAAQQAAEDSGMSIGLIGDLAVGVTPGGSDCWAMPDAMLRGLTIGAPPDPLGPLGQNWSITGFSPEGLRATGYAPWIAMIRAAMRSCGGLRIDHAFGLARLWVIPDGGTSADGAYLSFPFEDLVRLATLEAHRANCLVIAEDLGTAPPGFTHAISDRHMLGMRVLWFERAEDHGYIGARDYPANAVAMTGTHDTQTVAGWWSGRDLDWADQLGRLPDDVSRQQAEDIRAWDRGLLWSTIGDGDRPADDDPSPVVDAAIAHVAATPATLCIVPVEDLTGEREQPNLPGTTTEHPNWRRRLSAPMESLLQEARVRQRLEILRAESSDKS